MEKFNKMLSALLSGRISIIIYILMFIYLVPIAIIGLIPGLHWLEPSTNSMLIGDNYTSVLAALGASIAAGAGIATHQKLKEHDKTHEELKNSLKELHAKMDRMETSKKTDS
ncbi:MAG: hypothetical protein LBN22_01305 [Clostridiales Family XIII bacterium]|nr:hypothetical protein [Clostridiales Family XIII bacterium]